MRPDIVAYHLCQDKYGLWFIVSENAQGVLKVEQHGDRLDPAMSDAKRLRNRDNAQLITEEASRPEPPDSPAGYREPQPRRTR